MTENSLFKNHLPLGIVRSGLCDRERQNNPMKNQKAAMYFRFKVRIDDFSFLEIYAFYTRQQSSIGGSPSIAHKLNPLPDDKILDRSKLKQIADDILKCISNGK